MTHKSSTFTKAAIAITLLTSSVAFAQNASTTPGTFIPADGVVGAGVGGGSAVGGGIGAGLSTGVIIGGAIVAAVVVSAIVSDNKSSGTTGTR